MVNVLAVRGANGVTTFRRESTRRNTVTWNCSRDAFSVAANPNVDQLDATLQSLAAHAATHVGAISQVVELDI